MALFFYFVVYTLLVFVLRSFLFWKKTGINPFTFGRSGDAHDFNGKVFGIVILCGLAVVSINLFRENWIPYLLPFWYLEYPLLQNIGWVLLGLSLMIVWTAQTQMSDSWRIGIDEKNKSTLVTKGLFSFSRNPIFLGILMANLGLFMVIPNAFTLLILIVSKVSINTQVRLEEAFLEKSFGDEYKVYKKRVRRWI